MNKIIVDTTPDNFNSWDAYSAYMGEARGWTWSYNVTKKLFGDDGSNVENDWKKVGDEYISCTEIFLILEILEYSL